MTDITVIIQLVLILGAALVGCVLALWLKQPVMIGYLIAGVIIGPYTPGPRAQLESFQLLAEVGVGLLLFVLGSTMAPSRFRGLGWIISLGGAFQIILTIGLGLLLMPLFGLSLAQGFLLGAILAQSSSAVIARVLDDRGETDSTHGRIGVGISIVQDISSLPLLLLLLVFLGEETATIPSFLLAIGKVFGLAIVTYVLGRLLWPRLLEWFGRFGSGEITLLATLTLALGGGLAMHFIGLSFALGAFLAGLVLAESPRRPEALSRIMPLRDIFAAVFFVSIGALFNPAVLWQLPLPLLGLLGALIIGKAAVSTFIVRVFGYPAPTAILSGLLLAQIGEFAFILATIGLNQGAISEPLFSVIIASACISIFVNSIILDSAPPVLSFLARVTRFGPLMKQPVASLTSAFMKYQPFTGKKEPKD